VASGQAPETPVLDAGAVALTPSPFLHIQVSILDIRGIGDTMHDKVVFGHIGRVLSPHFKKNVNKLFGQLFPFAPGKDSRGAGEFFDMQ
jgi:energy-converting hydrogenase Eha subunit A